MLKTTQISTTLNKRKKFIVRCLIGMAVNLYAATSCRDARIAEENAERAYYTQPFAQCPIYTKQEFQAMLMMPPQGATAVSQFSNKLSEKLKDWHVTGTEPAPYDLWVAFRKELFADLEAEELPALTNYLDKIGGLIQAPTKANEAALIQAVDHLNKNEPAKDALLDLVMKLFNSSASLKFSEAFLAYQAFFEFIMQPYNGVIHLRLGRLKDTLVNWKKEGRKSGLQLWEEFQKKYDNELKDKSKWFQFPENRNEISSFLTRVDGFADAPNTLTYLDIYKTIPNGLRKLLIILEEVQLKDTDDINMLAAYCKLIERALPENLFVAERS